MSTQTCPVPPLSATSFPYRLAAIDIDDTLVGPDKVIGIANRNAVRRLQDAGCRVILASGRRHANMLRYAEELGLTDFLVSCQGARAQHLRTNERIHEAWLTVDEADHLTRLGLSHKLSVLRWQADAVVSDAENAGIRQYVHETGDPGIEYRDLLTLSSIPAEKISWFGDRAYLAQLQTAWPTTSPLQLVMTNDGLLEFSAAAAHKAAAVAAVAAHLNIAAQQVLAFGDGNNDVTMLQWAGLGVAMPHGRPSAHAAANVIAPHGDPESALARAVDELFSK